MEDRYLRLKEEHMLLKKTAQKQEDQIKKLATKMTRLINEKKKLEHDNRSVGRKRDVELEEIIEDLHDRVRELEKQNTQLREKLLVAKQQVVTQVKRSNAYNHVKPKVNTGRPRSSFPTRTPTPNFKYNIRHSQRASPSNMLPPYALNLLEEARNEIKNLEEIVTSQRTQIDVYEQEMELLKEQVKVKEAEYEEEVMLFRAQLTHGQRQHVQENMDMIRLHRELKQKSGKLATLQSQYLDMEEKTKILKVNHDHLLKELDDLNTQLKEEQNKNLEMHGELKNAMAAQRTVIELQEQIKDLQKENTVLKESNDKLISSAFEPELEKQYEAREKVFKQQISNLELSLKTAIDEKNSHLEQLMKEKEKYQHLEEEHHQLQANNSHLKERLDELEEKMKFLTKDGGNDLSELEEALLLIHQKKEKDDETLDFLEIVDEDGKDLKQQLRQAQADHAETVSELDKTRNMLLLQYKINKDCQAELKAVNERASQQEKEYQTRLEEFAQLLDIRAARIKKLEKQLHDIAYGTKQYKIAGPHGDEEPEKEIELERGQNLFEIHIEKVILSSEGLRCLEDNSPSTFATWTFYEFELQSTPVVKGARPEFNCTSHYIVQVDDFFLLYLQNDFATVEFHQCFGTSYKTVATCQMSFQKVLDQPHGRHHESRQLIGAKDGHSGVVYGTIAYWMRLCMPMEHAVRLYKEKSKALGYLYSNKENTVAALKFLDQQRPSEEGINNLHIKIIRCSKLKTKRNVQQSAYCVYKFYELPDQDTAIIPASNNPEFNDHRTFPLNIDSYLDTYLRNQNLEIYVFDDADPEDGSFIGKAEIPLLPLAQNKPVKGIFQLTKANDFHGSIEVSLYWQYSYFFPVSNLDIPSLPEQMRQEDKQPIHSFRTKHPENNKSTGNTTDDVNIPSKPHHFPQPHTRTVGPKVPAKLPSSAKSQQKKRLHELFGNSSTEDEYNNDAATSSPKPKAPPRPSLRKSHISSVNNSDKDNSSPSHHEEAALPLLSSKEVAKSSPLHSQKSQENDDDNDVIFGSKQEISFEDVSDEHEEEKKVVSNVNASDIHHHSESDSDVCVSAANSSVPHGKSSLIVITVSHLTLKDDAAVLSDPAIQMLFVEYRFLDYSLEELETPFSLPKPVPPHHVTFNFRKVFHVDPVYNEEKFQMLASMLTSNNPNDSRIKFTIVSEPPEDHQDLDCEDIGYAVIDLKQILAQERDIIDEDIEIFDAKENTITIGMLNVTVEALEALKFIQSATK